MAFKKLILPLKEILEQKGFDKPLPCQKKIWTKIKSGASMFAIAPEGSGKTSTIVWSSIQKLKGQAKGDAPRVLIFVKDKQAALNLESDFFLKRQRFVKTFLL